MLGASPAIKNILPQCIIDAKESRQVTSAKEIIDSLKEISRFFSVSIDELLTGEKLISIAEKENKSKIQNMCNLLYGIVDVLSIMLIVLPLYPNPVNGYIYSVNLFAYTQKSSFICLIYWIMFIALIAVGIGKILLTQLNMEKGQKMVTIISLLLSILAVLFLAMAREPYAITVVFLLLIVKGMLIFKENGR